MKKTFISIGSLVLITLTLAFVLRTYGINSLLFFGNDQGQDATIVTNMLSSADGVFVGTETSASRFIYLGPLFYYVIAPLYAFGHGNPIYPAVFLILMSTLSLYLIFRVTRLMFGTTASLIALTLTSFSYYMIFFSRWLSNTNLIVLLSALLIFSMYQIMATSERVWWLSTSLLAGLSFHFQAASGFFYLFVLAIFMFWQRKEGMSFTTAIYMFLVFISTFIPEIIYDFNNQHIISREIIKYISNDTFGISSSGIIHSRLLFFKEFFGTLLLPEKLSLAFPAILLLATVFVFKFKELSQNRYFGIPVIFMTVLFVGSFLFKDHIMHYYFSGFFVPFFMLVSVILAHLTRSKSGMVITVLSILILVTINMKVTIGYLNQDPDSPYEVSYKNKKDAMSWIAQDYRDSQIDIRVFAPDESSTTLDYGQEYKYLLQSHGVSWGNRKSDCSPGDSLVPKEQLDSNVFYVIREYDHEQDDSLGNWINCNGLDQNSLLVARQFGGLTVEKMTIK